MKLLNSVFESVWFSRCQNNFQHAANKVKDLKSKPSDDELLSLYGLFKQGSFGDVNTERPGVFDFRGRAKWDSWKSQQGKSQADAQQAYIKIVDGLINKYGLN